MPKKKRTTSHYAFFEILLPLPPPEEVDLTPDTLEEEDTDADRDEDPEAPDAPI